VWHAATQRLEQQGKVAVVAIVQDQHPDRARLFLQWKQINWPVMADSLDLLNLETVPMTFAVDEYGIVRFARLPMAAAKTIEEAFVNQTYAPPPTPAPGFTKPDLARLRAATSRNTAAAWNAYGDAAFVWGGDRALNEVIDAYYRAEKFEPANGLTQFKLGSALRKRYDSSARRATDFQEAAQHWTKALDIYPNRYIWRRRGQQYGPHLPMPYAFFDWVREARVDIAKRGETPIALAVEPGDSELAAGDVNLAPPKLTATEPDARGRIIRDKGDLVSVETVSVPPAVSPGQAVRVHVVFRPNLKSKAHWNNEVDPLVFWINPTTGWTVNRRATTVPNPKAALSQESRTVEFELTGPAAQAPGIVKVPGYALYYVCEDINGVCMYRRRDVDVSVQVVAPSKASEP
jgi:hypothetical protein